VDAHVATKAPPWRTGWTAKDPLPLAFNHCPASPDAWAAGPFPGLEVRELGLSVATRGLMAARQIRVAAGAAAATTPWRAHELDFHFLYVLQGRAGLETAGEGAGAREALEAGATACLPGFLRYRLDALSSDFELLEITGPGDPKTVLGRDTPLPGIAQTGAKLQVLHETRDSFTQGAGPRKYFQYRDLGTARPTDGRIYIHIVRATEPQAGGTGWHTHTMRQWFWVLRGSAGINVEGRRDIERVGQYDAMCISAGLRHNVPSFTSDYMVIEMCIPEEYETTATPPPA
jgi:quercetin dioxygenase-like cupin family protein